MMVIYSEASNNVTAIDDYFAYNSVPHTKSSLWDNIIESSGRRWITDDIMAQAKDSVLVLTNASLFELVKWPTSYQRLVQYFQQGGRLWAWSDADGFLVFTLLQQQMEILDALVAPGQMMVCLDARPVPGHWCHNLKNIEVREAPYSWFCRAIRVPGTRTQRHQCTKDFMITMVRKSDREHRDVLWHHLSQRPKLLERGHAIYHERKNTWLGETSPHHHWNDGHPSMDLYLDSYLEIVVETMHQHGWFYTEKTNKAIATKTPFLVATTPGYLSYLHDQGFQTFGSVIDEGYDQCQDLGQRMRRLVDTLEHIIHMGAHKFHELCQPMTEHNRHRLNQIQGSRDYDTDLFLLECMQWFSLEPPAKCMISKQK